MVEYLLSPSHKSWIVPKKIHSTWDPDLSRKNFEFFSKELPFDLIRLK